MKSVNVRRVGNDPSDALRTGRKAPVVIMNRNPPEVPLLHLDAEARSVNPVSPGEDVKNVKTWRAKR